MRHHTTAYHELAASLFESCLEAPYGIIVKTTDSYRHKDLLYRLRGEIDNPNYANIKIDISPMAPEFDLLLINDNGKAFIRRQSTISISNLEI